jgi:predicted molibdopterin-dependent oxidoreductase YjgC
MADVTITVDGKKITAPAGSLLIEVCKTAGIEIPAFCYYPGLSLQAACRMCVVRQEKVPKLQTACTTQIAEGQVFFTDTPEVVQARKATLQLLLGNHPLDCPVCDAGGECELQDMTFKYGAADSFYAEPKNHREEQQWSPVVYFDRPRCILCYRCVRVCGEGMDVFALAVENRGSSSIIVPNVPAQLSPDSSRAPGLRAVRHVHRCVPGGRTHKRHVSLQDAAVGDEPRRDHLYTLRRRMQDHARRALYSGWIGDCARRQSRQVRHQRRLPL